MINLLPWRKMKRDQARKRIRIYTISGVIAVIILMYLINNYFNMKKDSHPLLNSTTDQIQYQKNREKFKEQLTKTVAKAFDQSLDSFHYIGLLKDGSKTWALISQTNGVVFNILQGDYLGKEHARIVNIKTDGIEIEKSWWNKQGLNKKRIVLALR